MDCKQFGPYLPFNVAQPINERTPHTQQRLEDSVASAHAQAAALRAEADAAATAAQRALEEAAAAAAELERRVGHVTRSLPQLVAAISRTGCNAAAKARVFGVAQRTGTGTGTKGDTKGAGEGAGTGAAVVVPEEKVPEAATELGLGPGVAAALVQQQVRPYDTMLGMHKPSQPARATMQRCNKQLATSKPTLTASYRFDL